MFDFRDLDDRAARQHGLVTTGELIALGLSHTQTRDLVRAGRLERVRHKVYRTAGAPRTWEQAVLAVVLAVGAPVYASHWTALALWGLAPRPDDGIHATVPDHRCVRLGGVRGHRTTHWPTRELTRSGIAVSSAARAVFDVSADLSDRALGRLADEARRRDLLTVDDLDEAAHGFGPGRTRSVARLRRIIGLRRGDPRAGESPPELDLYRAVLRAGLPEPVQNLRLEIGGIELEIDLGFVAERVALDYDGWLVHRERSRFDADRDKDRLLASAGWLPLRVTSATSQSAFLGQLAQILRARRPAA